MEQKQREFFSSRWALVFAALGMAIGTGNIWRFPRIAALNGGGAFLVPWILFLFLWSIPLLITEFAIGKKTRLGPVGAIGALIGRKYTWMGGFVAFCTIAIMFYYSVVTGWCLNYTIAAISGGLSGVNGSEYWNNFSQNSGLTLLFHFVGISIGALIVGRGIKGGIETATKFLIPSLGVLLIIGVVRGLTLPDSIGGLEFLFAPNWGSLLDYKVWLAALSQSAWSTGAGWGLIMTYAVYIRQKEDVALNSFIAGLGNNSASLLAAMAIFPAVFALAPTLIPPQVAETVLQDSGPASTGLTFIWIPELFRGLPASNVFLFIFFLALSIAAISSLIAMIELAARSLMDMGWTRRKAVLFIWIAVFLLGAPSAINLEIFQNQDWVWGLALMVSGFLIAVAANKYGIAKFSRELVNTEGNDLKVGAWYTIIMKYIIPLEFVLLIAWWFYQVFPAYDPEMPATTIERLLAWLDPTNLGGIGTCLVQWGIIIALFLAFNN
ncbi:MAG: sodium-dependent transporter, partial [bacterium]